MPLSTRESCIIFRAVRSLPLPLLGLVHGVWGLAPQLQLGQVKQPANWIAWVAKSKVSDSEFDIYLSSFLTPSILG